MLSAFVEMKVVVIQFLDRASNGLADYTLSEGEWEAISDLVKALKVRLLLFYPNIYSVYSLDT